MELDVNATAETIEERERRELAYQKALDNAALNKARMLERAKNI